MHGLTVNDRAEIFPGIVCETDQDNRWPSVGAADRVQYAGDKFCHPGLLGWRYPEPGGAAVAATVAGDRGHPIAPAGFRPGLEID